MKPVAPGTFSFGPWLLDPHRRMLLCNDVPAAVNRPAFDMLVFLVTHRNQVLTRDEIIGHVWAGLSVGENNLTVQMSNLRRALGDSGGTLIATIPGRGYQFVGEVTEFCEAAAPTTGVAKAEPAPTNVQPGSWRNRQTGAAVSALFALMICALAAFTRWPPKPAAPRLSIAVLPWRNLSADHAQDYLADALTDDLTTDLAHIPQAIVIARESADVWRGKAVPVQQIGNMLHVRYLVEGSLRVENGLLHVNAQLINSESGVHLWADQFDVPQSRLADARDAVVHRTAAALDFTLTLLESARSHHDRPDNPDSLDLFFQARAIIDQDDSLAGLTMAQSRLEEAVSLQPDFSDALAELGAMLLTKVRERDDPDDIRDYARARSVVAAALRYSPRNAKALAAQARMLFIDGQWTAARYKAAEALTIEPSNVEAEMVLATVAQAQGDFEHAVAHLEACLRLTPNLPANKSRFLMLGYIRLMQRRLPEAFEDLHLATAGDSDADAADTMGRAEITQLLLIAATGMQGDAEVSQRMFKAYMRNRANRTVWRFGSQISRPNSALPGFSAIMAALHQAGMPWYADEHTKLDAGERCIGSDYTAPPATLPNGLTLDTNAVAAKLLLRPQPLVIDVGRGVASPKGAFWWNADAGLVDSPYEFASQTARTQSPFDHNRLIIIMGEGTYGCTSFATAQRLIDEGYRTVAWYRGGEEAWAAAGQPAEDHRPQ